MRKNVKKKKNYSIDLIDDIVPEPNRAYPSLARANAQPKDWPPAQSWRNLELRRVFILSPGFSQYKIKMAAEHGGGNVWICESSRQAVSWLHFPSCDLMKAEISCYLR